MASLPVWWIEAQAYCHATEVEDRVAHALEAACPGGVPDRDMLEGQYRNPIVRLCRRIEDGPGIRRMRDHWHAAGVLADLRAEFDARIDEEGILHFRLDKQKAFGGVLVLAHAGDVIDVRVKLKAFPAKREGFHRVARALLEVD